MCRSEFRLEFQSRDDYGYCHEIEINEGAKQESECIDIRILEFLYPCMVTGINYYMSESKVPENENKGDCRGR